MIDDFTNTRQKCEASDRGPRFGKIIREIQTKNEYENLVL